jgi:hypothetical protein
MMRSDGERFLIWNKTIVLSNILIWTLESEVQTQEIFVLPFVLSAICVDDCIGVCGRYPLAQTRCHFNHSMRPFVSCAFVPANLLCRMRAGDVVFVGQRVAGLEGDDWRRQGHCPGPLRQDWSVYDTIFSPPFFSLTIRSFYLIEIPDNTLNHKTVRWNVSRAWICFGSWCWCSVGYRKGGPLNS